MNDWIEKSVDESMSDLYWNFRDSLEDEGGEKLSDLIDKFGKEIKEICKEYDVSV